MKIEVFGEVKQGVPACNWNKVKEELQRWDGKRVRISVELYKKKRSDPQNRYYFGCLIQEQRDCFKERFGTILSAAQVHEFNKNNFFCIEMLDESTGEVVKIPDTSTKYSTTQWEEKMEQIRQYFYTHFDWKIPLPNEQKRIEL